MTLLADGRTGIIPLTHDTPLIFSHISIPKNLTITTGATSIKWAYGLNTNIIPTYGGEVGQILSAYVDSMTITGQTRNNDQLKEIYDWFVQYMQLAGLHHREEQAVKFTYPERGWVFYLQPRLASDFHYAVDEIAIPWTVTSEVVADNDANYLSGYTMSLIGEAVTFDPSLYDVGFNVEQPDLQPNFGATLADNFQALLGAWATGDFHHWGFDVLKSAQQNELNPNAASIFEKAFGTDLISGKQPVVAGAAGSSVLGPGGTAGERFVCSLLNGDQNAFANGLANATGLSFAVIAAWCHAEEPASRDASAQGHNWLNIGPARSYPNVQAAVQATVAVINQSNMAGIKASESKTDMAQLQAIWQSPWDAGHYGGNGQNLYGSYNVVKRNIRAVLDPSGYRNLAANYARQGISQRQPYVFGGGRPMSANPRGQFPGTDCSGYVELCYFWATADKPQYDPMGTSNRYTQANSEVMQTSSNGHSIAISNVRVGDLATYGNHHVVIFVEDYHGPSTLVVSNGGPGSAHLIPISNENQGQPVAPVYRSFLP